jgi:hypothetical protein
MPKGATFSEIKPFEPLVVKFSTLWYLSDMNKQWKSNSVFHTYYNQLKIAIYSTPYITLNTLYRFRPLMNFSTNRYFIYMTARADEHKQQLQSYYKLTEEDLEEITDAGASQASQRGDKRQLEKHPVQILKMLCNDNEIIKWRGHLYNINGP